MLEYRLPDGSPGTCPVWLPDDFDPSQRWPLLVFLHAYEERGDDNEHLAVGIAPALEERSELFRCIVLLPQCPREHVWSVVDRPWAAECASAEAHIESSLDAALAQYPVDPARVVLTGASMGGYGTFVFGAAHAARFAALAPICGGGRLEDAERLSNTPLRVVHSADDDVVPIDQSRRMVDAVRAANPNAPLQFDELDGEGHAVWDRAYRDPDFVRFLHG